jgi:hypothetical protein
VEGCDTGYNDYGPTDDDAKKKGPTGFANVELCKEVVRIRKLRCEPDVVTDLFPNEKREHAKLWDATIIKQA